MGHFRLLHLVQVYQLSSQISANPLIYERLRQILDRFLLQLVRILLKGQVNNLQLFQMLLKFLTNFDEVLARCPLMTLDHDVILPKNFDIFEKVVVNLLHLVVHILLKELDEFVWISHDL